jgi:hypothetical protein
MTSMDEHLTALFDYLAASPDGVTINDIADGLDVNLPLARKVVHTFRITYGADDELNLVCEPNGHLQPWLYRLVGTISDAQAWVANRVADAEARLETMAAVLGSAARATDGRSTDGKKARILLRAITRAQEDLAEIASGP